MAGYRPKSLDELNNLYDKAISAENEIKKGSSLLRDEVLGTSFEGEGKKPESQPDAKQTQAKEISDDVDAFIRRFSNEAKAPAASSPSPDKPQRKRPLRPSELQSNLVQSVQPEEIQPERRVEPAFAPPKNVAGQKEENLSGLMNDYAKIMNGDYDDEEEDETFSSRKNPFKNRRSDRKGRKKAAKDILSESEFSQKNAAAQPEVAPEPVSEPIPVVKHENAFRGSFEPQVKEPSNEPNTAYEAFTPDEKEEAYEPTVFAADDSKVKPETEEIEPSLPEYEPETDKVVFSGEKEEPDAPEAFNEPEPPQESGDYDDEPYERMSGGEDFEFGDIQPKNRSGGVIFAKVLLSVVLVLTLLSTVLTGVLVFTVNSERSLPGGYMFFSATNSYEDAEIKSNDFVICKKESSINDEDKVIFINRELRSFSFGVKTGEKTDRNGNEFYTVSSESVSKTDVLGVIVKTVPSLGKTVRTIVDNFLFVLLGLVALAIAVTLILCLAFKNRSKDYYCEYDNSERPFEDNENADESEYEDESGDDSGSLFSGIE